MCITIRVHTDFCLCKCCLYTYAYTSSVVSYYAPHFSRIQCVQSAQPKQRIMCLSSWIRLAFAISIGSRSDRSRAALAEARTRSVVCKRLFAIARSALLISLGYIVQSVLKFSLRHVFPFEIFSLRGYIQGSNSNDFYSTNAVPTNIHVSRSVSEPSDRC